MRRTTLGRLRGRPDGQRKRPAFRPELVDDLERREVPAAVVPPGFTESVAVSGLKNPESMAIAPDGRIFIAEAGGAIRVVKDGQLLPTPFDVLPVESKVGQGLMALAFDPNFARNHFLYAYELVDAGNGLYQNELVRIRARGDTAVPGSEHVLLKLPPFPIPPGSDAHDGASLHFGADNKLYISTGDLADGPLAQSLDNPFGKILRVNSNGTIPRDNPFYRQTKGVDKAIWAYGLRNPYTFDIQPGTGVMFINDVGNSIWEEIDIGARGANYGWPIFEGPSNAPGFTPPIAVYAHIMQANPKTVAISGGAFYDPARPSFPASYVGSYFFEDYGNGWIKRIDPATGQVVDFASGLPIGLNDLDVSPDGSLYFLSYGGGELDEISYTG